ncbi:DUF308 domain-containing protein [Lentilactobacillus laojiaonis]|uniref:DUF308 domain-containing protein n=1 Tax=Lentilactobacillus laojiaonis TaxID=2883998 RepID=UPI001D0A1DF1|nr:DUF308 domain-containing protein [Lentilactobacillus laojiaonis]UDM31674.1 DUF308 domain-containing protein [Lentilactobacillus laojiaonis]
MNSYTKKFNLFELIVGIIFVLSSITILRNPISSYQAIIVLAGILAIIGGIFELSLKNLIANIDNTSTGMVVFNGIADIIIGIILLFSRNFGPVFVAILFAIWFIYDSATDLWASKFFKQQNKGYYWFSVTISVIGLILGIILLITPIFSALSLVFLVGLYFLVYGIILIVRAF